MARWRSAPLLLAVAALAACRHVRRAEPPEPPRQASPTAPSEEGGIPPRAGRPRVPASPDALLGEDMVARLQRALAGRALLGAHAEGKLDAATRDAVRRFQRSQELAGTGFPDRETLERLGLDPDARVGPEDGARGRAGRRGARRSGEGAAPRPGGAP